LAQFMLIWYGQNINRSWHWTHCWCWRYRLSC